MPVETGKVLRVKSEWAGYLNHYPVTAVLEVRKEKEKWKWEAFLYFELGFAVDQNLPKTPLWAFSTAQRTVGPVEFDSEVEAHRSGAEWLEGQGFQFLTEVQ